jgi:zinc-binding alcohol dehydrogenase/oxidoreductase
MLAARIHEDGGPDVLHVEIAPDPVAGPGEVLVRLRAASLNHLDVWVRKGLPSVPKPRILGADGAGVVEALGEAVDGLAVGQRVVLNPGLEHGDTITVIGEHRDGTHAELIAIDAAQVFPLDDALSFEVAAAFPLVYETAYRMLVTRAGVREGEWALIWGIGGGVATAAFELCRALGVRTVVTSGSAEKLAVAREWGADVAVDHVAGDVVAAVREATGKGVDVVVETVGEATWARSLAAVRPFGRVVVCGATSGPNPPAQLHRFWWKQLTVMGSTMGTRQDFLGAYDLVRSGRARVHIDRVFPLADIAAAHARLEAGEQQGKIVLVMPDARS